MLEGTIGPGASVHNSARSNPTCPPDIHVLFLFLRYFTFFFVAKLLALSNILSHKSAPAVLLCWPLIDLSVSFIAFRLASKSYFCARGEILGALCLWFAVYLPFSLFQRLFSLSIFSLVFSSFLRSPISFLSSFNFLSFRIWTELLLPSPLVSLFSVSLCLPPPLPFSLYSCLSLPLSLLLFFLSSNFSLLSLPPPFRIHLL